MEGFFFFGKQDLWKFTAIVFDVKNQMTLNFIMNKLIDHTVIELIMQSLKKT